MRAAIFLARENRPSWVCCSSYTSHSEIHWLAVIEAKMRHVAAFGGVVYASGSIGGVSESDGSKIEMGAAVYGAVVVGCFDRTTTNSATLITIS